jgi:hypothetical protein
MSDPQAESKKAAEPLDQWRELRDVYIDIWAKAAGEAVNSEAYAQASGTMLETCLAASSPFRDAQKKLMVSALEQLNMPSRADFVSLAERLANLELLLDDMDAKLSKIYQVAVNAAPSVPTAESETSQPAPKAESETPQSALKTEAETSQAPPEPGSETKSAAPRRTGKTAKKGSR